MESQMTYERKVSPNINPTDRRKKHLKDVTTAQFLLSWTMKEDRFSNQKFLKGDLLESQDIARILHAQYSLKWHDGMRGSRRHLSTLVKKDAGLPGKRWDYKARNRRFPACFCSTIKASGWRDKGHQWEAVPNCNLLQMVQGHPLHFDNFIITRSVIERVTSLREVVQHTPIVQDWNPGTVHPGNSQEVIWEEKLTLSTKAGRNTANISKSRLPSVNDYSSPPQATLN